MITQTDSNHAKLLMLFQQRPDLFQVFDRAKYDRQVKFAPESLYRDGESNFIEIGHQLYRFDWETVEEFGVSELEEEEL